MQRFSEPPRICRILTGRERTFDDSFAAGVARLRGYIAGAFAKLGAADAEADASSLLSEMVGALSLARAEPDPAASDAILERSKRALKTRFGLTS